MALNPPLREREYLLRRGSNTAGQNNNGPTGKRHNRWYHNLQRALAFYTHGRKTKRGAKIAAKSKNS